MAIRYKLLATLMIALLPVAGCGPAEPTATPVPATATEAALTATDTPLPPTATPAPPTATRPGYFSRDELIADARPF